MKVKIEEEEILIDLTGRNLSSFNEKLIPLIKKKNFVVKTFESIPKKTVTVGGRSLNPHYFTCSCKDYRESAKKYPLRDLRRMCKHLFTYISKYHFQDMDLITRTLLEHKFWYKINNAFEIEINKNIIYISYTNDFEIFFVYLPSNLPVYYSYNCILKQWRDNNEPFLDQDVKRSLVKFIHRINLISKKINRQK